MFSHMRNGFFQALAVFVYTGAVGWFMFAAGPLFGKRGGAWAGISMLLLFVLSAALVGSLVFGRSVYWYLEGKKLEAVKLLFATLAWLAILTVAVLLIQLLF